jgi:propionyl-CoA carboxylase alpha chain
VVAGQNISPFYDPMLSKVIYKAPTRKIAIAGLCQALDEYVIQSVQHNAKLVLGVLRHPAFQQGMTPTSFLPTHYPDGFAGVELTNDEQLEYVAAVAVIEQLRRTTLQQPALAGTDDVNTVVVKVGGLFGTPYLVKLSDSNAIVTPLTATDADITDDATSTTIRLDSRLPPVYTHPLAFVTLNGKSRTLQVHSYSSTNAATGELTYQMYGADHSVVVQSVREHELTQHMRPLRIIDTSNLLLSPMPGTLIRYAVAPGDAVSMGQELCVVEAMKMQNSLKSPKVGVIGKCHVQVGDSLKRDQVILEFETKGDD